MGRFVRPVPHHIDLADDDGPFWIKVKKELNNGDQKRMEAAGMKRPMLVEGRIINPIDWDIYDIERVLIWLLDWSLTDTVPDESSPEHTKEVPVKVSFESLRALSSDTFAIIFKAVFEYNAELELAKKSLREEKEKLRKQQTLPATEGAPTLQ